MMQRATQNDQTLLTDIDTAHCDNLVMTTLPPLPCYLNGDFTVLPDAKVSVMDRGFIFGDGIYEVAPVYAGQPFRFKHHMARLDRSLAELRIKNPMTHAQWLAMVMKLIANRRREEKRFSAGHGIARQIHAVCRRRARLVVTRADEKIQLARRY